MVGIDECTSDSKSEKVGLLPTPSASLIQGIEMDRKNHIRRYGKHCTNCDKKLGKFRVEGSWNGKSVAFCSFTCQDEYCDKNPKDE